ncbi:MAG: glutamate 5-kinase [Candidatus Diapherotrites archaeon]
MAERKAFFGKAKRIVVKIGTNTITNGKGEVDGAFIKGIAGQAAKLRKEGKEIVIVTSGAIGCGKKELGLKESPRDIVLRQAAAAVGQSILMSHYASAFRKRRISVAQVLLTFDSFSDRETYLNLRNSINSLLEFGVVPVINENDPISTREIDKSFGDNDRLSAMVASKLNANALIMLSDVEGLFNCNPKKDSKAVLVREVKEIGKDIEAMAGNASCGGLGGMKSKVDAAKIAATAGCAVVILNGRKKNALLDAAAGKEIGTFFSPGKGLSEKERWLSFSRAAGTLEVDEGAKNALLSGKSLLAIGVKKVKGTFDANELVEVKCGSVVFARGTSTYSSKDLEGIIGKNSGEGEKVLKQKLQPVIKTENIYIIG